MTKMGRYVGLLVVGLMLVGCGAAGPSKGAPNQRFGYSGSVQLGSMTAGGSHPAPQVAQQGAGQPPAQPGTLPSAPPANQGVGAQPTAPAAQPVAPAGRGGPPAPAAGQPPAAPVAEPGAPPQAPRAADVKLVPYQVDGEPKIKMLQPEGWSVFRTISGDSVQISNEPIRIHVRTLKLRSDPPVTVEEYRGTLQGPAADGEIRQLQVPGTVSAFEMKYAATREVPVTILRLDLNGTTFNQTLSLSCPTELFSEWEPVFRKILASFEHDNLDATPTGMTP